ncbi:MAG: hypothetical protein CME65_04165 [Halobacteriovoraceae bacterium]|nr:hypothetical protein [Halobacteriovoraceae bacterium]
MEKRSFGEMLTDLRVEAGLSLRAFCKEIGFDAGNWSKIEREVAKPPAEPEFYDKVQGILKFSDEIKAYLTSKAKAIRIVPQELQDSELMEHMPAMLRKANGENLNKEEADKIVEWIRSSVNDEGIIKDE